MATFEITAPDGKVYEVEGATQEGALAALKKMQAQNAPPSFGDKALRQLGLTGRYVAEGVAGLPLLLGDATNTLIDAGTSGINKMTGLNIPQIGKPSGSFQELLSPLPQPETMTERIVSFPSRALAGAAAMGGGAAASGSQAMAPLAANMQAQAGGAIGGGLSQGVTAEFTDNPWAQLAAGVAGGALGGMAAGGGAPAQKTATTQEIKKKSQDLYKAAEAQGARLTTAPVLRMQTQIADDLTEFGYHPALHPRVAAVLEEVSTLGGTAAGEISLKNMQTLRRIAQNAANSIDDSERLIGSAIINRIDDAMTGLTPDDVISGNADEATSMLRQAASLWRDYKKSAQIEKAFEKGERAANRSGTGGNMDNALRQKISAILDSDSARRGFTAEEIKAMERIVDGTVTSNTLRQVGRLSPQSGFLPTALGLGAVAYGGPLAALPVVGAVAKPLADYATRARINDLLNMIRAGGQKPQAQSDLIERLLRGAMPSAVNNPPQTSR